MGGDLLHHKVGVFVSWKLTEADGGDLLHHKVVCLEDKLDMLARHFNLSQSSTRDYFFTYFSDYSLTNDTLQHEMYSQF